MKPARIVYLINGLNMGGAERQLVYLLERLDRARFNPLVVTIYADHTAPPHAPFIDSLRAHAVPLFTLDQSSPRMGSARSVRRLIALLWRTRPRIVHSWLHYANLLARAARPFVPLPALITSMREMYTRNQLRSERFTARLDDRLIVNAPHLRDQAGAARDPKRVIVIPNGLPPEHFAHNPDPDLRARLGITDAFVIAHIGRSASVKDQTTLIAAFDHLPADARLLLVGDHAPPLDNRVITLGAVDDVRPYLHAADLLALPSLREGLPNVILEAHAVGKPAIISVGANRSSVVTHGVDGWTFPTGDACALADAILAARALNTDQRALMAANARANAARYSVDVMVASIQTLYAQYM